ncbi:hypothetical protein ACFYE9_02375 [Rhizobium leguminosarum]|uniref:Uncharacterized protein n=1 Tax=Rhizobium leguminosarum TaxID=384 RepID=A0ACD5FF93_RHILE|nr:hypothetical protein [Rhizobium leguminosarum]
MQHVDGFADVCQEICFEKSEAYPRRSDKHADVDCRSSLKFRHEHHATSASDGQVSDELHDHIEEGIARGVIGLPPKVACVAYLQKQASGSPVISAINKALGS